MKTDQVQGREREGASGRLPRARSRGLPGAQSRGREAIYPREWEATQALAEARRIEEAARNLEAGPDAQPNARARAEYLRLHDDDEAELELPR